MKFNTALLQSLSNPELLRMVYGAESVPQEIAQELVRRFDELVTSGQIPDSSGGYEDEISDMRERIRDAISNLEDI